MRGTLIRGSSKVLTFPVAEEAEGRRPSGISRACGPLATAPSRRGRGEILPVCFGCYP